VVCDLEPRPGNFRPKMPNLQEESLGTGEEPDDLVGRTRDVGDE
jgi:hypothetical protein